MHRAVLGLVASLAIGLGVAQSSFPDVPPGHWAEEAVVRIARCQAISELALQRRYQAVLASPASWRGARQPVAEQFASIREALGREAPLLVADYAHAGSIGFPSVDGLSADDVRG